MQQKILVVDDERFNINVLVDLLKPEYKMMAAKSGAQALKAVNSANPPDLILLDIMMPEMDGYEVCRRVKENEDTRNIPIIFVTAMGQEGDETKGLELGAADYLTKPVKPAIVKARIKTQLELKKQLEELQQAHTIIEEQKNRMQTELNVGRDIQLAMVPKIFPEKQQFSINALLEPAREVGGDFYDVFMTDEEHLCFCVGDVSGKGVPAALFMAMAKTLIKSRATVDPSTASIVTHVNDVLSEDNDGCLFVTLFVCILNINSGVLLTTNAGHNPPLLKRKGEALIPLTTLDGPMVAVMPECAYTENKIQLEKGDQLLMFTDGVTEADTSSGEFYGDDRLQQWFTEIAEDSVKPLINELITEIHNFEGEGRQADDITLLALKYQTSHIDMNDQQIGFTIKNELIEIDRVNDDFREFSLKHEVPKRIIGTICMALDELLTNIISYAYEDKLEHSIALKISLLPDSLVIVITDDGLPFNPFNKEDPDTDLDIDEREIGGLGVHLVKKMFDHVSYQRNVNENMVTLVKDIEINQQL